MTTAEMTMLRRGAVIGTLLVLNALNSGDGQSSNDELNEDFEDADDAAQEFECPDPNSAEVRGTL